MRIAHVSDLHLIALRGAVPFRMLNKRITGYANLVFNRSHALKEETARKVLSRVRDEKPDHVIVTGDIANLALEAEFHLARSVLDDVLGLHPSSVTIVPGNHDLYTRGSGRAARFATFLRPYLLSDMPDLTSSHPGGPFPVVKLRGPAAIIGLATAVPRPPLVSSGWLGPAQLAALDRILDSPEVRSRTPVVALHHPLFNPPSRLKARLEGLDDSADLVSRLSRLARGLVVHGHLHRRVWRTMLTATGQLEVVGATSASLSHASPERTAGFNLYEIDSDGAVAGITASILDSKSGEFHEASFARTTPRRPDEPGPR
jgi:3',5'-cyclic AMP phosphodiesterase CpdA